MRRRNPFRSDESQEPSLSPSPAEDTSTLNSNNPNETNASSSNLISSDERSSSASTSNTLNDAETIGSTITRPEPAVLAPAEGAEVGRTWRNSLLARIDPIHNNAMEIGPFQSRNPWNRRTSGPTTSDGQPPSLPVLGSSSSMDSSSASASLRSSFSTPPSSMVHSRTASVEEEMKDIVEQNIRRQSRDSAVPDPNAPKKEISKMISTDKYGQPISRQLPTQQPTSASKTSQPPPTSAQTLTTGSDGASDSTLSLPSRPRSTVSSHYNGPYPHQAVERISVASQTTPSYQQVIWDGPSARQFSGSSSHHEDAEEAGEDESSQINPSPTIKDDTISETDETTQTGFLNRTGLRTLPRQATNLRNSISSDEPSEPNPSRTSERPNSTASALSESALSEAASTQQSTNVSIREIHSPEASDNDDHDHNENNPQEYTSNQLQFRCKTFEFSQDIFCKDSSLGQTALTPRVSKRQQSSSYDEPPAKKSNSPSKGHSQYNNSTENYSPSHARPRKRLPPRKYNSQVKKTFGRSDSKSLYRFASKMNNYKTLSERIEKARAEDIIRLMELRSNHVLRENNSKHDATRKIDGQFSPGVDSDLSGLSEEREDSALYGEDDEMDEADDENEDEVSEWDKISDGSS